MSVLSYFRRKRGRVAGAAGGHMTFAHTSAGRTLSRTGLFLKKQLWVWPIIAVAVLSVVGFSVRRAIEKTMKGNLESELKTLLNVETAMLETWFRVQESNAESLANNREVRETFYALAAFEEAEKERLTGAAPEPLTPEKTAVDVKGAAGSNGGEVAPAEGRPPGRREIHARLRRSLAPGMTSHDYVGYFVADKSRKILSATNEELIGQRGIEEYESFLARALEGETVVSPPFPSQVAVKDEAGKSHTGVPTMFVCGPIRDPSFQVVGALALRIQPEKEFTRILQLGRVGESGETYAFDKNATMVSNSRFDAALILLGLIPDQKDAKSILSLSVHDPGGDMTQGFHPEKRRSKLHPTKMAAEAITKKNEGVDVEGYRDYRGVPVVGAWKWLDKHDIGVVTEVDVAEAYRPLIILQRTFLALYTLLGLASVAIFAFTVIVARLQREARKAAVEAKQLGQYTLERKLGQGGMGVVYKGHHAMLRRPTAVKMLDVEKVNDASIERFEREVQITCQLNHPNTIAIYDYGRTPEGVFYYAMEYLDGIDLQSLVDRYGPQPEARVIRILNQVCGSLFEAHSLGMVHRDIKPANIMINRRGGEADVVKVLDFGLVKAADDDKQANLTSANSLTGTPLYMSPEAIQAPNSVDGRSDLYAVGAVGYFLLTGQPVFSAKNIVELCQQHVETVPPTPSEALGRPVSSELEGGIMACLEKSRFKRPPTARDLARMIGASPAAGQWTGDDADSWWTRMERGSSATIPNPAVGTKAAGGSTAPSPTYDRTVVTNNDE